MTANEDTTKVFQMAVRKFEPFERFIQKTWSEFCQKTGCQLRLQAKAMELPELHQSLLPGQGLKNGRWDLAMISSDWMTEAISDHSVTPIEDLVKETDYFQDWPQALLRSQFHKGQHYGVPFHDGPQCLIYRKDLFESPDYRQRYQSAFGEALKPPESWETFHRIARFFQDTTAGFYGTALAGYPDGHNAVYDFCLHTWTRGGSFLTAEAGIDFEQPAVMEGLAYYRSLIKDPLAVHKEAPTMDSVRLGTAFATGKIAMMINWFGFATYAALAKNSPVAGKIGIAPIPHHAGVEPVAPNSYWMYAVGNGSDKKAIAMDFIQFATSAEKDIELTLEGGIGCRKSTWKDTGINQALPFFHQLETLHGQARELPDIPDWPQVASIIDDIMTQVATTEKAIPEILQRASRQAAQLQTKS